MSGKRQSSSKAFTSKPRDFKANEDGSNGFQKSFYDLRAWLARQLMTHFKL